MNQQNRSRSNLTANGTLSSAVADAGTFTISYPDNAGPGTGVTNAGDFYQAQFHTMVVNQARLTYPDDFDLSFGTSNITVTNKTGATWAANSKWFAEFDQPGKRIWAPDRTDKIVPILRTSRADTVLLSLGAPDILDADGICASQSISAGTNSTSTSATLDGALASTNATTGLREVVLDVPRNIQAAWTTTAVLAIEGYDEYGEFMVEKSASGTSHTGTKAFKRISRVWSTVAITSATVGTADVFGLPCFLPDTRCVMQEIVDGNVIAQESDSIWLTYDLNATDFLAGTVHYRTAPVAGQLRRFLSTVTTALAISVSDLGTVALTVNAAAVTGSTLTTYGTAASGTGSVGDVASTDVKASSLGTVTAGNIVGVAPSSTWGSAGAMAFAVELVPSRFSTELAGTFVAGITTSGGSTATTGDVRGTYAPSFAADGSKVIQLLMSLPDIHVGADVQYTE